MSQTEAELALAGIAASLIDDIVVARSLELSASLGAPPRGWRTLGPLARSTAEAANPDLPATADRPGKHFCDICGCADEDQIEPGPDCDHFGADHCAWMCKDANARACEARKLHRYPPRPDLVPEAFLSALGQEDEARAARSRPPADQQEEPARQEEMTAPPGWQPATVNGVYDVHGQWHPALPQVNPAYVHTLMNPAHRAHLLSGQSRPHYYGGPRITEGAESQQEGAQQQPLGGQPARREIPPYGLPEGVRQAIQGDHASGDIQMQPGAAPQRPARSRRRGLVYRGVLKKR